MRVSKRRLMIGSTFPLTNVKPQCKVLP